MSTERVSLEVCVDTIDGLQQATVPGVARIELCGALAVGGTTPAAGLLDAARHCPIPVFVMIRPRDGDFVFSAADETAMLVEIAAVRRAGFAGVVLGASRPGGRLDEAMLERLSAACGGLRRTLHRAFDLVPDPLAALEVAIGLGFERILTSGGARQAIDGTAMLAELVRAASGRIEIMAGSGVTATNVAALVASTRVRAVHGSCRAPAAVSERLSRLGFGVPHKTSRSVVEALLARLDEVSTGNDRMT